MLDRKTPPPFIHSTSFDLLKPNRKKLPNGIEVFLIPGGDQEVVKVELILPAGRWHESVSGASHFAANLLTKGTLTKNSFDIAQIFDRFGAHVEIHPGLDYVAVSIYSLTKYVAAVLELVMEVLTEPVFPEKELSQSKSIFIQNLKVNEEKTSFLASKAFRKNLFGENHPYGREIEEKDVNGLQQPQLIDHYKNFYKNYIVFVSGKFDSGTEQLITDTFSAFKSSKASPNIQHSSDTKAFHERLPKEGSVQSSIRAGKKSIRKNHKDYASALFVSHILGGYFGSRLMKNIREEKGLTYGIYASLQPLLHESYLAIGADVDKDNVELTLDEIRKELKILRTEKISEHELHTAKNHFIGSLQSEITTPFAHADKIKTIYLSGLDEDYYHKMILSVDAISADEIISTSETYFHEDTFSEVTAG